MAATPEEYKLKITEKGFKLVEPEKYKEIAKSDAIFKIYIFRKNSTILYVGLTRQRISTRLSGGFRSFKHWHESKVKKNGYSGHKFIQEFIDSDEIELLVFPLKHLNSMTNKEDYQAAEAIEAEIVYLIREKTNRWPVFQNEIHFYNLKDSKKYAKKIFSKLAINSKAHAKH
ncbi:MAG: hypothetical protein HOP30_02970 [Cyclobacteriaceae bacterium]|nr:hypothetical protein [Cyclobacteriaceae bacterium]